MEMRLKNMTVQSTFSTDTEQRKSLLPVSNILFTTIPWLLLSGYEL